MLKFRAKRCTRSRIIAAMFKSSSDNERPISSILCPHLMMMSNNTSMQHAWISFFRDNDQLGERPMVIAHFLCSVRALCRILSSFGFTSFQVFLYKFFFDKPKFEQIIISLFIVLNIFWKYYSKFIQADPKFDIANAQSKSFRSVHNES